MKSENMAQKGAEITIQCLINEGIDHLFAYPGGASMELHQALSKQDQIRVVLPRHEQGGGFSAAGFARATGKVGVCMATSGPGATNLVTAIADAQLDSIPMVAITGQVPRQLIGKSAFQETDIVGMTLPIVKHSYLVLKASDIPAIMAEAFHIATSGRPGVVLVDIPKNIQQERVVAVYPDKAEPVPGYKYKYKVTADQVKAVKEALVNSTQPCLYVGGGIISSEASEELLKFAEGYNIPVVTTLMGVGCFPEKHKLSLKWLGMHGSYYGNYAANESDLLICIGARFDDRVTGEVSTFAPLSKIIHVDIDPSEINKNKQADIGITSDAKYFLEQMNEDPIYQEFAAWHKTVAGWKKDYPLYYEENDDVQPQHVIEKLCELTNGEAIIVPGVGQHQMWSGLFYTFSYPRQFLTSAGLGTMGFGLPTAIGAKIACPEKVVINIDGDGSFQMNIQELGCAFVENVAVKMVILNNQHLGMVAQWEDRFYDRNRGNTVLGDGKTDRPYPDFVTIAKGYGIPGREVYKKEEIEDAIREMLETPGPFILDVHTKYEEHVLPMIPSGGSYKDIILK
ncbi:MAG: biosynthetic-type acetolactate synthase large subunit [Lentisphaeria bacterium]|nr:biosynthetic-type acetolactate synthase large subunit [Lentisphaeria bacterium]